MIQLSKRLETIANLVPRGSAVADIGSDHALLPVYLLQQGKADRAVAGEVNPGPLQAARKQVLEAGLTDRISVRSGNGLEVISPREVDTIVIAGMGGGTIVDILSRGAAEGKLEGISLLVLQPNIGERLVREWFLAHGWKLVREIILEEDGITYEILAAVSAPRVEADVDNHDLYSGAIPRLGHVPAPIRLLMGPMLLAAPNQVFMSKWSAYLTKLERMMEQIGKSESVEAHQKKRLLHEEYHGVKEVLECLSASGIS